MFLSRKLWAEVVASLQSERTYLPNRVPEEKSSQVLNLALEYGIVLMWPH